MVERGDRKWSGRAGQPPSPRTWSDVPMEGKKLIKVPPCMFGCVSGMGLIHVVHVTGAMVGRQTLVRSVF